MTVQRRHRTCWRWLCWPLLRGYVLRLRQRWPTRPLRLQRWQLHPRGARQRRLFLGRQDAFFGHNHPDRTEPSILYRNLGDRRFEDTTEATGLIEMGWTGDASIADINGDGSLDLYITNMQGDDHLWINQQGKKFVERQRSTSPRVHWGAMGIRFFDWNNDGHFDLMLTDMHSDMSREVFPGYEKLKSLIT